MHKCLLMLHLQLARGQISWLLFCEIFSKDAYFPKVLAKWDKNDLQKKAKSDSFNGFVVWSNSPTASPLCASADLICQFNLCRYSRLKWPSKSVGYRIQQNANLEKDFLSLHRQVFIPEHWRLPERNWKKNIFLSPNSYSFTDTFSFAFLRMPWFGRKRFPHYIRTHTHARFWAFKRSSDRWNLVSLCISYTPETNDFVQTHAYKSLFFPTEASPFRPMIWFNFLPSGAILSHFFTINLGMWGQLLTQVHKLFFVWCFAIGKKTLCLTICTYL